MCYTRDQAEAARSQLTQWLAPRGLSFNEDKTRIVHIDDGFDFLGFNVRRYGGKLLIKPSKAAVTRFRQRLTAEVRSLRGSNAKMVIITLNPIIRGWAAYYRGVVSKEVFTTVDNHLWQLTYRWALRSHPNKPRRWVVSRYFGKFNRFRQNRWIFGDRDSGAYLRRFDWTKIVRHRMVMGNSSPDDPALTKYWAERRHKGSSPLNNPTLRMLHAQDGRCPACGDLLLFADHEPQSPREWEQWIKVARKAVRVKALIVPTAAGPVESSDGFTTKHLLHASCSRLLAEGTRRGLRKEPETPAGLA